MTSLTLSRALNEGLRKAMESDPKVLIMGEDVGKLGGVFVTPLVNHPEVGILGIHRIAPRPVVVDGEIVVRHIGNVSVTFDHRVVDGARAAAFTLDVIARLESGLLPS